MQGVELLFQALLARLARIDVATAKRGHDLRRCRRPKKRGPDQRVPVIRKAMSDSEAYFLPFQVKPSASTTTRWVTPFHSRASMLPGLRPISGNIGDGGSARNAL